MPACVLPWGCRRARAVAGAVVVVVVVVVVLVLAGRRGRSWCRGRSVRLRVRRVQAAGRHKQWGPRATSLRRRRSSVPPPTHAASGPSRRTHPRPDQTGRTADATTKFAPQRVLHARAVRCNGSAAEAWRRRPWLRGLRGLQCLRCLSAHDDGRAAPLRGARIGWGGLPVAAGLSQAGDSADELGALALHWTGCLLALLAAHWLHSHKPNQSASAPGALTRRLHAATDIVHALDGRLKQKRPYASRQASQAHG